MRKITGLLVAIIVGGTIGIAITTFYKPSLRQLFLSKTPVASPESQEDDFKKAQSYLSISKPEEAMKIINKHKTEIENQNAEGKQWLDLLVEASVQAQNTPQLMHIFSFDPNALASNEKAALIVADQLISTGDTKDYETLRALWKGHTQTPERWFILDADALILEKKTPEAIELLQSQTWEGSKDTNRLVRLALLHMSDQPKTAWNYLVEAQKKNPDNTDIRTYRARFLESIGKPELALTEYLSAVSADSANPHLKDQLAEFYIRSHKFDQALKVWSEALNPPTSDSIWLNSIFWSRMITPIQYDWADSQPPQGYKTPLINYLLSLPPGEFWDRKSFEEKPDLEAYLNHEQSTFWLRMLQYLKNGEEDQAYILAQYNPFAEQSWDAQLLESLQRVLNYRRNGTLKLTKDHTSTAKIALEKNENPLKGNFFVDIDKFAHVPPNDQGMKDSLPQDMNNLLMSPEVFSALFLAGGWREAGLDLHKVKIIPPDFPPWVGYNITDAMRANRSVIDALRFASSQKKNPSLSLLSAELMMAGGSPDAGMIELEKLISEPGEVGYKASWLLSLIYLEKKNYDEAKKTISANSQLEKSLMGQEALGRIAILQGDQATADKIYNNIASQSTEAKSYLARRAFADKDWEKAQKYTEELLKLYPNNQILKDNLQKIQNERGKKQS